MIYSIIVITAAQGITFMHRTSKAINVMKKFAQWQSLHIWKLININDNENYPWNILTEECSVSHVFFYLYIVGCAIKIYSPCINCPIFSNLKCLEYVCISTYTLRWALLNFKVRFVRPYWIFKDTCLCIRSQCVLDRFSVCDPEWSWLFLPLLTVFTWLLCFHVISHAVWFPFS